MNRTAVFFILLLLASIVGFSASVRQVKSSGTIYIRTDGSVEGTDKIATVDNITYTFMDNITDSIVVERSHIIVDGNGYTLQGSGTSIGIHLEEITNSTVRNLNIHYFIDGVYVNLSSYITISHNTILYSDHYGVSIQDSANNTVSENTVAAYNLHAKGVFIGSSSGNIVSGNSVTNTSFFGVLVQSSSGITVTGNNIADSHMDGVILGSSSGNIVSGNNITNSGDGVFLIGDSNYNTVSGNNLAANIYVGVYLGDSFGNIVYGNNITGAGMDSPVGGDGVVFWASSSGNTVTGNNITAYNRHGVSFNGFSSGNRLYCNNIYGNQRSFFIRESASGNKIYHNNIVDNTDQMYLYPGCSNVWDNGYPSGGNYWSDYTGEDNLSGPNQDQSGSDGIGDTPNTFDENNRDNYPFITPIEGPVDDPVWTIMVYLDADNDLEYFGIQDFLEMSSVGSSTNVNILVQMDRIPGEDDRYGDWTGCKRYRVTMGMTPTPENALADLGEVNMGEQNTLTDFLTWAIDDYQATHYILVLWGDGGGTAGVCWDDTANDHIDMMELNAAASFIHDHLGHNLDIIGFDACIMSLVEVAYQILEASDIMIGSEENIPGSGWPYDDILSVLVNTPLLMPSTLATLIVEKYIESYEIDSVTLSAFSLAQIHDNVAPAAHNLAQELLTYVGNHYSDITDARDYSESFGSVYRDLYDFASECKDRISQTAVQDAAQDLMTAIDNAQIAEGHKVGHPDAHGLSIYWSWGDSNYDDLCFAQDTKWDEFLMAYHLAVPYFPYWKFSNQEQYYPISFYFDNDIDVENNTENFVSWSLEDGCAYVHVVENEQYFTLQYWLYYPYNNHLWYHVNDWDSTIYIMLNKITFEPERVRFYRHWWPETFNWDDPRLSKTGTHIEVFVAEGSHAAYISPSEVSWYDEWNSGGIVLGSNNISNCVYISHTQSHSHHTLDVDGDQREFCNLDYVGNHPIPVDAQWNQHVWWPRDFNCPVTIWDYDAPWHRVEDWNEADPSGGDDSLIISVHSPVDLHVYDSEGHHVGRNTTGGIELGIPGAYYSGPSSEPEVVTIPHPNYGNYTSLIVGTEAGTYNYTLSRVSNGIEVMYEEYADVVIEENETHDITSEIYALADIRVLNLEAHKTVVGQGFNLSTDVEIVNFGSFCETFNVTLYANMTEVDTQIVVNLCKGSVTYVPLTWNTTGFVLNNYTMSVYAWSVPFESRTADNTLVSGLRISVTIAGDVDGDFDVDIFDIVPIADAYGSEEGQPEFVANCDIDSDGDIDIFDVVIAAGNYG